jgi:hypothetical protein
MTRFLRWLAKPSRLKGKHEKTIKTYPYKTGIKFNKK